MPIQTEHGMFKPIIYLGAISLSGLLIVKYKVPPNPDKQGWWIPAPEINYGEDPAEEVAKLVKHLGLTAENQSLVGVDSFMANEAWHLVFKYKVRAEGNVAHDNIEDHRWVTLDSLPPADTFAHGNWERELSRYFLSLELQDYL